MLQFFLRIIFPQAPENKIIGSFQIISKIPGDICKSRTQGAPPLSPVANLPQVSTTPVVNFATGDVDTCSKLPPESMTPAVNLQWCQRNLNLTLCDFVKNSNQP
jgi:hypothetical protein